MGHTPPPGPPLARQYRYASQFLRLDPSILSSFFPRHLHGRAKKGGDPGPLMDVCRLCGQNGAVNFTVTPRCCGHANMSK